MHFKKNKWLNKRLLSALAVLLLVIRLQQSCKKQDNSSQGLSKTATAFLNHPNTGDNELEKVIANIGAQLLEHDFSTDFILWHGQPLWDKAVKIKTGTADFYLYIPTKKDNNRIETFFIATCKNNVFSYEMHRRSALNFKLKEYTSFNYSPKDYAKILAYFDSKVLNRKDTLFLNNTIDGLYAGEVTNPAEKVYTAPALNAISQLCWLVDVQVYPAAVWLIV